ncbi:MAG: hypothetical protein LBQ95_02260 [Lachnospiraceae bacterium]|jgi:predicted AAA+ superfamily ATPase|nr:hypothetical protein [Lachnospiraceae bacterium]
MRNGYRPRIVDTELLEDLERQGAVLIEGPKACGKTETARRTAKSEVKNMLYTEFDEELAKKTWQEEAFEDGMEAGIEKGTDSFIKGRNRSHNSRCKLY